MQCYWHLVVVAPSDARSASWIPRCTFMSALQRLGLSQGVWIIMGQVGTKRVWLHWSTLTVRILQSLQHAIALGHLDTTSPNHCAGVNHMQLSYASRSPNRTCVYSPLVPMDISKTSLDFKNPFISDIHSCVPEYFRICRHLLDIQLRAQVSKSFSIFTG